MKSIFVIGRVSRVTTGHGESSEQTQLVQTGAWESGDYHPAFANLFDAIKYIESIPHAYGLRAVELKVQ